MYLAKGDGNPDVFGLGVEMTGLLVLTSFLKNLTAGRSRAQALSSWLRLSRAASGLTTIALLVMPASSFAAAVESNSSLPSHSTRSSNNQSTNPPTAQSNDQSSHQFNDQSSHQSVAPAHLSASLSTTVLPAKASGLKKRTVILWKLGVDGESFKNEIEHAQIIGLGLNGELRTMLLPGLMLRLKAGVALQNGYAQSDFGDTVPHNGLALSEAIVQYHPWQPLYFQVGALDESFVNSAYLPSGSFPGALQKVSVGSDRLGLDLIAQAAIPTSTTLKTQTADKEPTPLYMTQSLTLKAKPFEIWQIKTTVLHFKFENLPSLVAFNSVNYGNTILDLGPSTSAYAFHFDGWLVGGDSKLRLSRGVEWMMGSHVIENLNAPSSYRLAQWVETSLAFALPEDINFIPKFATFFAESDVAPGFYNSSDVGHNNRAGWAASTDFEFKKQKFKVGATYSDAAVINPTAYQTHQQFIQLRFESLYDLI